MDIGCEAVPTWLAVCNIAFHTTRITGDASELRAFSWWLRHCRVRWRLPGDFGYFQTLEAATY